MAAMSSDRPAPTRPEKPRISPRYSVNDTALTRLSARVMFSTTRTGSPAWWCAVREERYLSLSSRPTMSWTSLSTEHSATGRVATATPSLRIVTRSASSITSFSLWLMKTTDAPRSLRRPTMVKSSLTSSSVSEEVGSSITMTRALNAIALAISTIWRSEIESCPTRVWGARLSPTSSSSSRVRASIAL